jgi:alkyl hydroperoxide reductase subunit D
MTLEALLETTPPYAKDLKLNLSSLLRQTELTEQQIWGTALSSAIAARNSQLLETLSAEAGRRLSQQAMEAAKTAAALMGMNNIYYRFLHMTSNSKYATIPARLRMNGIRTHGIDQNDFELWCTAVSAINGCAICVESHQKALLERGVSEETILAAVRIAAVIHGLAGVFDGDATGSLATGKPIEL